jgi:uncharacterized membrane protein YeaQ/YmgE (transglycosylase-associated protein family)
MATTMMTVIAATLAPGNIVLWLIVGLIAGFLASAIMRGGGYGILGDLIVGLIGAFIGGLIVNLFVRNATSSFWGSIVVAFVGACILIALLRAISSGTRHTY